MTDLTPPAPDPVDPDPFPHVQAPPDPATVGQAPMAR